MILSQQISNEFGLITCYITIKQLSPLIHRSTEGFKENIYVIYGLWVVCYFIAFNRLNTFVYIENLQYVHIQVSDLLLVPSIFLFSYRLL